MYLNITLMERIYVQVSFQKENKECTYAATFMYSSPVCQVQRDIKVKRGLQQGQPQPRQVIRVQAQCKWEKIICKKTDCQTN